MRSLSSIKTPVAGRLIFHLQLPLYRNGYALLVSSATTNALGLFYWIVAARHYSADTVGLGSATLSAMMLLSGISQLGLNSALVRFVPLAGRRTARLVGYSYLVTIALAVVISSIFLLGLDRWAPSLNYLNASAGWQIAFVGATAAWGIFALQDAVLTGLRQALWVPLKNATFAIAKIVLLVVLAGSFQSLGIFASWNLPVLVLLPPIHWLISKRLIPQRAPLPVEQPSLVTRRVIVRFTSGNYLGSLFFQASTTLLPIMVTNLAGPSANAYFYPPWAIVTALQLVALNMSTSLTVEATLDRGQLGAYSRRVLKQIARLVVPLVVVVLIGAPLILQVFGSAYAAEGTSLLRWLTLGVLPNILVALFISIARVQNHPGRIALVQALLSGLILSLSYLLLPVLGITGVGIGWLTSQTVVALALLPALLRRLRN